jgi:hypothetical protein
MFPKAILVDLLQQHGGGNMHVVYYKWTEQGQARPALALPPQK